MATIFENRYMPTIVSEGFADPIPADVDKLPGEGVPAKLARVRLYSKKDGKLVIDWNEEQAARNVKWHWNEQLGEDIPCYTAMWRVSE